MLRLRLGRALGQGAPQEHDLMGELGCLPEMGRTEDAGQREAEATRTEEWC